MKTLKILAGIAVVAYGLYLLLLFCMQRSMLFPGVRTRVGPAPPAVPGLEVMRVRTSAGDIEMLFLPAHGNGGARPLVIFAHGNGEVTDQWTGEFEAFRRRGIGVLLVEYPGYGRSTGAPSEAAIRVAMDAAYDRVIADPRVDRDRIVGFGRSLGGGAIGLLSTFPSLDIFAADYRVPAFLMRDRFDNLAAVRAFKGPILVIHGRNDELIPWPQAERLAAAAKEASFRLYDCGHNCWDPAHTPFWSDVDPFLARAGLTDLPQRSPARPETAGHG